MIHTFGTTSSFRNGLFLQQLQGQLILKWVLRNTAYGPGLDSMASGYGPVAGTCEHGNESSGSTQSGKFLHQPSKHQLLLRKPCSMWTNSYKLPAQVKHFLQQGSFEKISHV
jgi:hypothetical protein